MIRYAIYLQVTNLGPRYDRICIWRIGRTGFECDYWLLLVHGSQISGGLGSNPGKLIWQTSVQSLPFRSVFEGAFWSRLFTAPRIAAVANASR